MILVVDDARTFNQCLSIKHRETFYLKPLTENQVEILRTTKKNKRFLVRSYYEAVDFVDKFGLPDMILFDHDLGNGPTGYDFLKWLCNQNLGYFEAYFHSANPIGRKNMEDYYEGYLRFLNDY